MLSVLSGFLLEALADEAIIGGGRAVGLFVKHRLWTVEYLA